MDLVCTEEMKQLLMSPIIKETKPVTNGTTYQQGVYSGTHSDALYIKDLVFHSHLETVMALPLLSFSDRGNPKFGCNESEMKPILHCDWLSEQTI